MSLDLPDGSPPSTLPRRAFRVVSRIVTWAIYGSGIGLLSLHVRRRRAARAAPAATETRIDTLDVPGARLHYSVRGSGPVLLLIAGGAGNAESFDELADHLVARYTIVTYDRRGYSRSPLDDPAQRVEIETHSDDVHRLLAALGAGPVYVLGCSIGALIGLDLTIHHPEQVHVLVAHQPPVMQLLSGGERSAAWFHGLRRREGGVAAIAQTATRIGMRPADRRSGSTVSGERARTAALNGESFHRRDVGAVGRYTLDIRALEAAPTHIVVAGGTAGRQQLPYVSAARLAGRLQTRLVELPGNHAGFAQHPREFAERLREVLDDEQRRGPARASSRAG